MRKEILKGIRIGKKEQILQDTTIPDNSLVFTVDEGENILEAPIDNKLYARKNESWEELDLEKLEVNGGYL